MKKNEFIEGALIATIAIILSKILGVLYVIPFYNIIGENGGSLYGYAYNIYNFFLIISSAGIPLAISKITSEYNTLGKQKEKTFMFKYAKKIIFIFSIICFLICFLGANFIADSIVGNLSGGERIKLFLLIELMKEPTVLLLDEPSNDLDLLSLNLLEELIINLDIPVIFISHDEHFLSRCANRIVHIESLKSKSEARVSVKNLSYDDYNQTREDFLDKNIREFNKDKENFEKKIEKYNRVYQSVNYALNTVSRQAPSVAKNLKDKMHSIKSMEKRYIKEKENLTQKYEVEDGINLKFDNLDKGRSGSSNSKINYLVDANKEVLDLNIDSLKVNSGITLIDKQISLYIKGAKKVALIGENGVGKTTLLRLIYHELKKNTSFKVGYMSQNYEDELLNYLSPLDYLSKTLNVSNKEDLTKIQTYLGSLKLTYEEMNRSISSLSGGEKAKIFFAKIILEKDNVMLLDEPTRNISPLSNKAFINSIKEYNGVLIAVSHDRNFVYQVFDDIYELDKENGLKKISKEEFYKRYL